LVSALPGEAPAVAAASSMSVYRIAIFGSRGRLGSALKNRWSGSHDVVGFARPELDLLRPETIRACFEQGPFDWVVNCAASTNVDACEIDPETAFAANETAPRKIAAQCQASGSRLIHISTDYVFDGTKAGPYTEDDLPSPLSIYGQSKAAGDTAVQETAPDAIIARVSWVFGPEKPSFIDAILKTASTKSDAAAVADKWSNPTYTSDVADWLFALIENRAPGGIYHLCNAGGCTWRDYGEHALQCAAAAGMDLKTTSVAPIRMADISAFVARRPVNTVMTCEKFTSVTGIRPRAWEDAVKEYVESVIAQGA